MSHVLKSKDGDNLQLNISIFHVFKTILEYNECEKQEEYKNFLLEYEGLEDFSIYEENFKNGEKNVISIHQSKMSGNKSEKSKTCYSLNRKDKLIFVLKSLDRNVIHGYYHLLKNKKITLNFNQIAFEELINICEEKEITLLSTEELKKCRRDWRKHLKYYELTKEEVELIQNISVKDKKILYEISTFDNNDDNLIKTEYKMDKSTPPKGTYKSFISYYSKLIKVEESSEIDEELIKKVSINLVNYKLMLYLEIIKDKIFISKIKETLANDNEEETLLSILVSYCKKQLSGDTESLEKIDDIDSKNKNNKNKVKITYNDKIEFIKNDFYLLVELKNVIIENKKVFNDEIIFNIVEIIEKVESDYENQKSISVLINMYSKYKEYDIKFDTIEEVSEETISLINRILDVKCEDISNANMYLIKIIDYFRKEMSDETNQDVDRIKLTFIKFLSFIEEEDKTDVNAYKGLEAIITDFNNQVKEDCSTLSNEIDIKENIQIREGEIISVICEDNCEEKDSCNLYKKIKPILKIYHTADFKRGVEFSNKFFLKEISEERQLPTDGEMANEFFPMLSELNHIEYKERINAYIYTGLNKFKFDEGENVYLTNHSKYGARAKSNISKFNLAISNLYKNNKLPYLFLRDFDGILTTDQTLKGKKIEFNKTYISLVVDDESDDIKQSNMISLKDELKQVQRNNFTSYDYLEFYNRNDFEEE